MHVIMASTSTIYGSSYLEYLQPILQTHFDQADEILFIPFARPGGISHDTYTTKAREGLKFLNKRVRGLHEKEHFKEAIKNAQAIFTGGGNTFLLVKKLYEYGLMELLKKVIESGTPYLGTSAGSNICGLTMKTTNDMPISYPPSFKTLGLVPFNINPHYLDPDPDSKHKGETRETRIKEFQNLNKTSVVGLREGSWIEINGKQINLKGKLKARLFEPDKKPYEIEPETTLNHLD